MNEFDLRKYLGTWFEIARIKNKFEPEMTNVKAEYSLNRDGSVKVTNSGYIDGKLSKISGVAEETEEPGVLRLSFFPGQESFYKILFVSDDYSYALVGGDRKDNLWVLSRTPELIEEDAMMRLLSIGLFAGYRCENIIFTEQDW